MAASAQTTGAQATGALPTVRRLVLYILFFTLVTVAAMGASGLLALGMSPGETAGTGRTSALARAIAFLVIAGPLALLLWRTLSKRLLQPAESAAPAWGLYLAAMYATALITASTSSFSLLGTLAMGRTDGWGQDLAAALVWGGVWWWHQRIWRNARIAPRSLPNLPGILGSWYGLLVGATAVAFALSVVFSAALGTFFHAPSIGSPWWKGMLAQLPWIAGGLAVWWWHWVRRGMGLVRGGFADVALVLVGVLAAGAATLGSAGYLLYTFGNAALRGPSLQLLAPAPLALGTALAGSLVCSLAPAWFAGRLPGTLEAGRQVVSGLGLAAGASGLGVCINAALASLVPPLAGDNTRSLLLAGLIWLVLGAVTWWRAWRPGKPADPRGRRVYLVAVFGISAVVALIALLVAGFRFIEFLLEPDRLASGLLESVRAPIGLLTATALVSLYHFVVWRADRTVLETTETQADGALESILLVAGGDARPLRAALAKSTGARVRLLARAGDEYQATEEELAAAIASVDGAGPRIMLLIDGPGSVRAIELE
ncbi:hypothetical protein JOF48_001099 [Arthrobacter stackebrandtii]|uniref:DUF5671 domain-containing protein n=1 Tax=Arthrobacter stackebrandtii TaxID=272161 RepID=A0ABS4YU20_9MICC|nr:DUF5671 domain-containing protein [Arthrobacter stackebrandtii]MBP2412300.1 hypothetical protein [Arthrobacter stackebrandtii]PYH02081.1 hypothetical protein CVV67_01155 [Arthrobacter stackebrandtii]